MMKLGNFIVVGAGILICLNQSLIVSAATCIADANKNTRFMSKTVVGTNIQPHLHRTNSDGTPYGKATTTTAQLNDTLLALKMKSLRFPGGAEANNYHWRNSSCVNNLVYPFSWANPITEHNGCLHPEKNLQFMDFLNNIAIPLSKEDPEFEIILQINMVVGLEEDDDGLARNEAKDWIKSITRSDFPNDRVWWEMGNELYLPDYWPMSASEYAARVKNIARKLRSIDPKARIMIIGPSFVEEYLNPGFRPTPGWVDKCGCSLPGTDTKPQDLFNAWFFEEKSKSPGLVPCKRKCLSKDELCGILDETCPEGKVVDGWWDVMYSSLSGFEVNGISVHRYDKMNRGREPWPEAVGTIKEIFDKAKQNFGNDLKLGITEYNVWKEVAIDMTQIQNALLVIRMHLSLINIGADMTNLWPFSARQWKASMAVKFEDYSDYALAKYFKEVFLTDHRFVKALEWRKVTNCTEKDEARKNIAGLAVGGNDGEAFVYLVNSDNTTEHTILLDNLWKIYAVSDYNGLTRNKTQWSEFDMKDNFIETLQIKKNGRWMNVKLPKSTVVRIKLRIQRYNKGRTLLRETESMDDYEDAVAMPVDPKHDLLHTDEHGNVITDAIVVSQGENHLLWEDDEADEDEANAFVQSFEPLEAQDGLLLGVEEE